MVLSFDGQPIQSSDSLQNLVTQTPPKKSVAVEIVRDKEKMTLTLVLGERPESADTGEKEGPPGAPDKKEPKSEQKDWLGAKVTTLTPELAETTQQPKDAQGVLVVDVKPGSDADQIGVAQGDLIRGVDQTPTPDLAAFRKATDKVRLSQGVVLDILRQGRPIYLSFMKD